MSGNEMMDIPNEEKPMCMVAGEWGGGAKMMMIDQMLKYIHENHPPKKKNDIKFQHHIQPHHLLVWIIVLPAGVLVLEKARND